MAVYHGLHRGAYYDDRAVADDTAEYSMNVAARIIYFVGGIVIGLLAIRFLLALFGANPNNAFASFIYDISHPLAAPFFNLFNYNASAIGSRFELGTLVAIVVYGIVTGLLARLVTLGSRRPL